MIKVDNFYINVKLLQLIILITLMVAFSIELWFGIPPCTLCILERALWIVVLIATVFNAKRLPLIALIFINTIISFGHMLIQYFFVNYTCAIIYDNTNKVDKIFNSCNTIDFTIFGLSLVVYNLFITLLCLALVAIKIRKNYGNIFKK